MGAQAQLLLKPQGLFKHFKFVSSHYQKFIRAYCGPDREICVARRIGGESKHD